MAAQQCVVGEFKLDPRIEKAVDDAYRQVEDLYVHYKIMGDDWHLIRKESPRIMARIEEIEDTLTGWTPIEEVYSLVGAWVKNYESAFRRRSSFKQQQLAG